MTSSSADADPAGAHCAAAPGTATPAMMALVDVIIVNWNTRELLRACLSSLYESGSSRLRQIIVVENDSTDGSADLVREQFPDVKLITPGRNTGYAAGNNLGLRSGSGDYFLLLNPDTRVHPGDIDTLAAFLDARPRCGVAAPQLASPDGTIQRSCRSFPTPSSLLPELTGLSRLAPALGSYRMAGWDHRTEREVDQPMGSALLVRRAAIDQAGLMDEDFPLFFNEVDWLYRIKNRGWQVWFTPSVQILHHHGASTRQVPVKSAWLSHTGLHSFYRKHYRSRLHPLLYRAIVAAIYARALLMVLIRLIRQLMLKIRP